MNVECLDLDSFDINTHEPPNYNDKFVTIDHENDEEDLESCYSDDDYSEDTIESDNIEDTIESDNIEDTTETDNSEETKNIDINVDGGNQDFDLEECDNVIYSYPFYSKDNIDYEYRVTITDEELLLEQVKCDDSQLDFNDCVEVFAEIYRGELVPTFELIQKNIDLRDQTKILQEGIIDYNFEETNKDKLISKIENNKISALYELYKEIVDSVYE